MQLLYQKQPGAQGRPGERRRPRPLIARKGRENHGSSQDKIGWQSGPCKLAGETPALPAFALFPEVSLTLNCTLKALFSYDSFVGQGGLCL